MPLLLFAYLLEFPLILHVFIVHAFAQRTSSYCQNCQKRKKTLYLQKTFPMKMVRNFAKIFMSILSRLLPPNSAPPDTESTRGNTYVSQSTKLFTFFTFNVVDLMYQKTFVSVNVTKHCSISSMYYPRHYCTWSMYVTIVCQKCHWVYYGGFFLGRFLYMLTTTSL